MTPRPVEAVFVHGAFSDDSHWDQVLAILHELDMPASAAQVNAQGFAADVEALRKHLEARAHADVILVGHSYGGTVISEVAENNPQVRGLVYVAAAAPIAGVPFGAWMAQQPNTYQVSPVPDADGLLRLSVDDFLQGLAHDLPEVEGRLLWALQKPAAAAGFGEATTLEGWRSKPCWYVVAEQDRIIAPEAQRELAKQMDAVTCSVPSGHMVALVHPEVVADAVIQAAQNSYV
jgi:pimeloyl-ACP methyl ester carboxylesterase